MTFVQPGDKAEQRFWVSLVQANVVPRVGLDKALRFFGLHKLDVVRCHMDQVKDPVGNANVCMQRMLVEPLDGASADVADMNGPFWTAVKHDLRRAKWVDDATIQFVTKKHPWLGLDRGEIIVAMANMVHGVLAKQNLWAFSKANIATKLQEERYVKFAARAADLFIAKFDPKQPLSKEELNERIVALRTSIKKNVEDTTAAILLDKMMDVVDNTYRTNLFLPNRYSLAFRIDPRLMMAAGENRVVPYGVFFVHGRRFNGFHVRFRDISRGGLRIVSPPMLEQVAIEGTRQFDEAYGLAFAQQLKNKDIPEGGSKCVVLVDTASNLHRGKVFAKRKAVKGMCPVNSHSCFRIE